MDGPVTKRWAQIVGRGVATHPEQLPTVGMEQFVQPVAQLTRADCPAGRCERVPPLPLTPAAAVPSDLYSVLLPLAPVRRKTGNLNSRTKEKLRAAASSFLCVLLMI